MQLSDAGARSADVVGAGVVGAARGGGAARAAGGDGRHPRVDARRARCRARAPTRETTHAARVRGVRVAGGGGGGGRGGVGGGVGRALAAAGGRAHGAVAAARAAPLAAARAAAAGAAPAPRVAGGGARDERADGVNLDGGGAGAGAAAAGGAAGAGRAPRPPQSLRPTHEQRGVRGAGEAVRCPQHAVQGAARPHRRLAVTRRRHYSVTKLDTGAARGWCEPVDVPRFRTKNVFHIPFAL